MNIEEFDKLVKETWIDIHGQSESRNGWYLGSLQREEEILRCWELIDEYYISKSRMPETFLEIGGFQGLWAIAFYSYCKLNGIEEGHYHTVTLISHRHENNKLLKTSEGLGDKGFAVTVINKNTMDNDVVDYLIEDIDSFDIVFIDADHRYKFVKNDIEKFYKIGNDIVMFHDIRPKRETNSISVYKVLDDMNIILDEEIVTRENSEGIGIKYIK